MLSFKFLVEHVIHIPELGSKRYSTLAGFPSTWECEQGFSAMMSIKTKSRNRLHAPRHDFRCAVSSVKPRIDKLLAKKQMQPSH